MGLTVVFVRRNRTTPREHTITPIAATLADTSWRAGRTNLRPAGINGREIAIPLHEKLLPTLSRIEYEMIKAALREHHGRVEPAAKSLGISRKGLYLKRQRLGL